jgi:hypothetical protein
MPSLRQVASRARTRTRVALFGNNHSIKVNLRYASYENVARRQWKTRTEATPEQLATAERFKAEGFLALPPPVGMTPERLRGIKEMESNSFRN